MANIFNLDEKEIDRLMLKISSVCREFWFMVSGLDVYVGQVEPIKTTFTDDFCHMVKFKNLNTPINYINSDWLNSVVNFERDSKSHYILKINVLKFLSITESDFKDYLDDKKTLYWICKYLRSRETIY
jgi:hypothetical protein